MGIKKYKYYFRKPKSEIVKDIFSWLLIGGTVVLASTSPYFVQNLITGHKKWRKYSSRKISDTFYQLRKQGFIKTEMKNHQMYISLTKEGEKKAGMFQIDKLRIATPKRWSGNWSIVMFDIEDKKKIYREALRGKLKEMGFVQLQESAWIHPFDCKAEVELLRSFFGLSKSEVLLIIAREVENDVQLRSHFKLSY